MVNFDVPGTINAFKNTKTGAAIDEAASLPIRLVNQLLSPLRKWLLTREQNFKLVEESIAKKLANTPQGKLQEPEPYIAVPALQAISYSMDSDELREMYSNLIAKAMHVDHADSIHPSFVEIIKQLSPFDAVLFKKLVSNPINPMLNIRRVTKGKIEGVDHVKYFIGESFENISETERSLSNLQRTGLINLETDQFYTDDRAYNSLLDSEYLTSLKVLIDKENESRPEEKQEEVETNKRMVVITPIGQSFAEVCLTDLP